MAVQQLSVNILSNPKDRDDLFKVIKECSDSLTRADAESDYVRESITEVSKKLQVPKKLVAKMVKVYHRQNYDEEVSTHEQFETLYQTVIK
jgi:hypothetical protein